MSFQGDATQIPLSNILQALFLNGQEGVLTLEAGPVKRRLRILKQGMRPLNYSRDVPDLLKEVLLKQKLLTESQLQNSLSTWTPGTSHPGDFLIARRIISQQDVTTNVLHQFQNLVMQLIITPSLKYEFTADVDGGEYEMFSPTGLGSELILSANGILMEALRRDDELKRIRGIIPSTDEIFIPATRASLSARSIPVDPRCLKEIKPLLNGENTIARLTALTTLSIYEVHVVLFHLLQRQLIRPIDAEEKRTLAEHLRRSGRLDDALEIYQSILAIAPGDHETRLKVVSLLEKRKDGSPEVASHYVHLASQFADTDPNQCIAYLQRALAIHPADLQALEMLCSAYQSAGNTKDALALSKQIVDAARHSGALPSAICLLQKLLQRHPEEAILYHELADLHLAASDTEEALVCLRAVAEIYERRNDLPKLRKTYEKMARLRPSEAFRLRRFAQARSRRRLSPRRLLRTTLAAAVIVTVSMGTAYWAATELFSRSVYAAILKDVDTHKSFGALDIARKTLEDFERHFPLSTRTRAAQKQLSEVALISSTHSEKTGADHEKQRVFSESHLTRIRIALGNQDYSKALDLLNTLDNQALDARQQADAASFREQIGKYFTAAESLFKLAKAAESSQDFQRSYQLLREIVAKHPHSPTAQTITLPIQIESVPSGADVQVESQVVGQTPILLRLPPKKPPTIILSRAGYAQFNLSKDKLDDSPFSPLTSHKILIHLTKNPEWRISTGGPVEGFPVAVRDTICLGTRNGNILCVSQQAGDVIWKFSIPESMDFAGGLGLWNNKALYFGSFDGKIYVLDSQTGTPVCPPVPASPNLWPIKQAPSAPTEKGLIAVNCDEKLITGYNLIDNTVVWTLPLLTSRAIGQPQMYLGNVFLCTRSGDVLEIDAETGKVSNRTALGLEFNTRGRISNGNYFLGSTQGKVLCLDTSDQRVVWSFDCGDPMSSPPTVDAEWVIVPTTTGKIFCLSTSGELKWMCSIDDTVHSEADGTVYLHNFLIGTRRGRILSIDIINGKLIWEFRTDGFHDKTPKGILTSGVVAKGRFFIGSEDHSVYCFTTD